MQQCFSAARIQPLLSLAANNAILQTVINDTFVIPNPSLPVIPNEVRNLIARSGVNSVRNLKARIKISPGACPERTDRFLAEFILSKKTGFLTLFGMTGEGLEMTNRFHL